MLIAGVAALRQCGSIWLAEFVIVLLDEVRYRVLVRVVAAAGSTVHST
jgi:hypothetical protein